MARKPAAAPKKDTKPASKKKVATVSVDKEEQSSQSPAAAKRQLTVSQDQMKKVGIGVFVGVLALLALGVIRDRNQMQSKLDKLQASSNSAVSPGQDEIQQLVSHLKQFMELPTDETPTLATVSNVEQLQAQSFFKHAQNGDKVLLYAKSGKAILYRPSTKKVIEVASINTSANPVQP